MHPVSTADTGRFGRTLVVVAVIPARFHSTRLPGKPLADINGRPMIEHVYRRAQASGVARTIVATDDERVIAAVRRFGGEAMLTRADHPSGTDRLAEVAASLDCDVVVNVQGDEPTIAPETIAAAIRPFLADPTVEMSTLARRIDEAEEFLSPNVVKVVAGLDGCALYFSRAPIPCARDAEGRFAPGTALKHIGLYVYRRDVLLRIAALAPTRLERTESLEQLRALEHGVRIRVVETEHDSIGVDTPADLARVRQLLAPVAAS